MVRGPAGQLVEYYYYYLNFLPHVVYRSPGLKTKKTETRLEWLRVNFIFSREGLTEENGVISLNELADSLEKVTTVKRFTSFR